MNNFRRLALALALGSTFGSAHAYVNIVFDYSHDTSGFFTADRRATLEQAAQAFETRVFDDLTAIKSTPGGDGYVIEFNQPNNSGLQTRIENANLAAGELRIFVGSGNVGLTRSRESIPIASQMGTYNGVTSTTSQFGEFAQNARTRGQENWPDEPAMWGGTITYDSSANWYADTDVSTGESFAGKWDLYSVTLKGLISILGANVTSDAWYPLLSGVGRFNGAHAKEEYGVRNPRGVLQAIPMEEIISSSTRLASNIQGKLDDGTLQTALFAWGLSMGERRHLTELDYAILDDMGWDVTGFTEMPNTPPVPEPQTWAMLAAGLGLIGLQARKKMRR